MFNYVVPPKQYKHWKLYVPESREDKGNATIEPKLRMVGTSARRTRVRLLLVRLAAVLALPSLGRTSNRRGKLC